VQRAAQPVDFARLGWSMTMPAGFRPQQQVMRHLGDEPAPGAAPAAPRQTLQAVLSDGLATVSVFIESGLVSSLPLDVAQRHGPASAFVRRVGDATVTVIGEVPSATVAAIANSVEFHDPH
jgi:sigma-E factor negative regulatory protein RseB